MTDYNEKQALKGKIGDKTWSRQPGELMDEVKRILRIKHYSIRTEQTYVAWIKKFIDYNNKTHPLDMGETEVEAYLTHLAVDKKVAGSTQNQAFNALLFSCIVKS